MTKVFWVLPDIEQHGKLWVVDSIENEKLSLSEFYRKYHIKDIAREFEIGIPEELLNKFKSPKFGFAQIIKNGINSVFSISTRCGKDIDGRTVTLTYIQLINDLNEIHLPDQESLNYLKDINADLNFQVDLSTESKVDNLKEAAHRFSDIKSFSSEKLLKTVYKHGWNGEDPSLPKKWIWLGLGGLVCLIFLSLIFR